MIDVCLWRARIGQYHCSQRKQCIHGNVKTRTFIGKNAKGNVIMISLVMSSCLLLALCGDIESNPGPKQGNQWPQIAV